MRVNVDVKDTGGREGGRAWCSLTPIILQLVSINPANLTHLTVCNLCRSSRCFKGRGWSDGAFRSVATIGLFFLLPHFHAAVNVAETARSTLSRELLKEDVHLFIRSTPSSPTGSL